MRARPLVSPLLALLLGAPLLAGCGAGGPLGTGNGFSLEAGLRTLPDVTGDRGRRTTHVVIGDLAAVGGGPSTSWHARLERAGVTALLPGDLPTDARVRRVLGFDARDVVSYASIEDPTSGLVLLSLTDGAAPKDGLRSTGAGDPGDRGDGRPFPVVLGVAQRTGMVALAESADALVDWADKGRTLDSDDALDAVARALDDQHVVAAELVATPGAAYDAVGVGQQVDGRRVTSWVAYRTDRPAHLASVVRRAWRTGTSRMTGRPLTQTARLDAVASSGDVVLVRLTPREPGGVVAMLQRADTTFDPRTEE